MVAAGVPRPRADHAEALLNLALDMRAEICRRSFGGRKLAFRIGINSGPVVAGVIGRKKFIYDLWGETVNVASRMEAHGRSGVIQLMRKTFDLVSSEFDCQLLGPIEIKGAGRVETWGVTGRKPGGDRSPGAAWQGPKFQEMATLRSLYPGGASRFSVYERHVQAAAP